ncbi:MerR family transcriptional regulator [Aneurinibacillus tyrosinisolvens]|uniref:MerR family transcriptional regulator n=1 Tax=Aneurinibacillus tyrosinisolvens TaxID=1443435 RepID=UPI00063F4C9F|nr:MerR family transcriptional regulator [Aneurinibacillus tyrosinisolvens]
MAYTVKELAQLSGVSVRTLHYYDEIGLLNPAFLGDNGYRYYEEDQLLQLQQILFFRELDFRLDDIQAILKSSTFDQIDALNSHKRLLEQRAERINKLIETVIKTLTHLKGEIEMKNEEIYYGFDKKQQEKYVEELKERYGKQAEELIEESNENTKNWERKDYKENKEAVDEIHMELAAAINQGLTAESPEVQRLIRRHYEWVNKFYTPTKEIYAGLGDLYVDHEDFRKMYDSFHPQLAEFLRDAMKYFVGHELS